MSQRKAFPERKLTDAPCGVMASRLLKTLRGRFLIGWMDGVYAPEKIQVMTELSFGSLLKELKCEELVKGRGSAGGVDSPPGRNPREAEG